MTTPPLHSFADIHSHSGIGPDTITSIEPGQEMLSEPGMAWYSVGIHPWNTETPVAEETFEKLRRQAAAPRVVAIGEAGLDALRGGEDRYQEEVFLRQAQIAEELGKPLIIHCVRRYGRIMDLHRMLAPKQLWVIHGFRGKAELARQLAASGIGISLQSERADIEAVVPPALLFRETDAQ